jgi:hypothetical protein
VSARPLWSRRSAPPPSGPATAWSSRAPMRSQRPSSKSAVTHLRTRLPSLPSAGRAHPVDFALRLSARQSEDLYDLIKPLLVTRNACSARSPP